MEIIKKLAIKTLDYWLNLFKVSKNILPQYEKFVQKLTLMTPKCVKNMFKLNNKVWNKSTTGTPIQCVGLGLTMKTL